MLDIFVSSCFAQTLAYIWPAGVANLNLQHHYIPGLVTWFIPTFDGNWCKNYLFPLKLLRLVGSGLAAPALWPRRRQPRARYYLLRASPAPVVSSRQHHVNTIRGHHCPRVNSMMTLASLHMIMVTGGSVSSLSSARGGDTDHVRTAPSWLGPEPEIGDWDEARAGAGWAVSEEWGGWATLSQPGVSRGSRRPESRDRDHGAWTNINI